MGLQEYAINENDFLMLPKKTQIGCVGIHIPDHRMNWNLVNYSYITAIRAVSWTTIVVHNSDGPKNFEFKKPTLPYFNVYKTPSWMSFSVVYICEQLLSLYVLVTRSFGGLYNSPSCSSCFTGLHPNQSKLHSLKC